MGYKKGQIKQDNYEMVANSLIKSLEESLKSGEKLPWHRPWASLGVPRNAFTNRPYSGMNMFLLSIMCQCKGWDDMRFATYNQIAKEGGNVKKGEKGTQVILWKFFKDKKDSKKTIPMLRSFTVFNVKEQTEGTTLKEVKKIVNPEERRTDIENIFKTTKAKVRYGYDHACYVPDFDEINLPDFEAFKTTSGFLATYGHELAHWTGHKSRLNRDLRNRFGTEAYAFEELVAEMTSAMLAAALGYDNDNGLQNNVAYLQSWIKSLKNDTKAAIKAGSLASAATRLILGTEIKEDDSESDS